MSKEIKLSFLKKYYLELLIFLLAIVLRYLGIVPGYPPIHPDEGTSYSSAIHMLGHAYNPGRFDYPAGMPMIHAVVYRTIFLPIQLVRLFTIHPQIFFAYLKLDVSYINRSYDFLFGNRYVYAMFWSRAIAATIGSATVVLLYFVVKRMFNRPIALAASAFLAVNYRHVLGSHFGLPDIHSAFFAVLVLLAAVMLIEKRTLGRYLFVGIAAGSIFSIKYQFFAFFPLLISHLYWVVKSKKILFLFHPYAWGALMVAVFIFLVINPYYPFNFQEAMKQNYHDYRWYQMGVMYFRPYGYFYLFHWGIGHLPSIALFFGFIIMLWKKPLSWLLISSFVFATFFFMTYYSNGGIYPRNFIPPISYLMIFAGFAIGMLYEWMKRSRFHYANVAIVLVMVGINYIPAYNASILSLNYAKTWNKDALEKWLMDIMPVDITIRGYQLFIDDLGRNAIKKKHVKFLDWDYSKGQNSLAEFQEEGTDFAIIQLSSFQSITYWWRGFDRKKMFLRYSDVPFDYITNSFFGLTLREFLPYTVAEIRKPWQAADELNYLIFKIPKLPKRVGESIARFSFDTPEKLEWKSIDPFEFGGFSVKWNEEGYNALGSLLVEGGGHSTSRVSSPPFPIAPGKDYLIRGWMKEHGDKTATYDGYLRLDFYKTQEDFKKETMSLGVALSSRVLPNDQWTLKEFSAVAPPEAHFATVSYQRFTPQFKFPTFLDDIEVFEAADVPVETFPQVPYIRSTIPYKDIFYNSFL